MLESLGATSAPGSHAMIPQAGAYRQRAWLFGNYYRLGLCFFLFAAAEEKKSAGRRAPVKTR
jgi:hypothetical protein